MLTAIYDLRDYGFTDASDGYTVKYIKIAGGYRWEVEELVNEYKIRKNGFGQPSAYSIKDLEFILKKHKLLNE